MKNFKKFIAVALAVFVSVFMLAVSAFASDTDSLVRMDDGTWNYMENGEHNTDYTGLVKYYDTYYYVENGVLDWSYTGPTEYNGTTYFVTNSTLDENYSSLVLVDGVWHYVENGVYSNDYSGLTLYYGTWYYVEDGVLNWDYTGLTTLKTVCSIGTTQVRQSITGQPILLQTARLTRTIRASFL